MAEEAQPGPLTVRTRSPGWHFCQKAIGVITAVFIAFSALFIIGIIANMDVMVPKNINWEANDTKTGFVKSLIETALRHLSARLFGDRERGEGATDMDTTEAHDDLPDFYNSTENSILWVIRNLSRVLHEGESYHSPQYLAVEDVPPVPSSRNDSSAETTSGAAGSQAVGDKEDAPAQSAVQNDSTEVKVLRRFMPVPGNDTLLVDEYLAGNREVLGEK